MISRQANLLGQARLDLSHLRAIESAGANDFDIAIGNVFAGNQALVIRGFTISTTNAIGVQGRTLQLVSAGGILCNVNASSSGTTFQAPANRTPELLDPTQNSRVFGVFTNGRANYVSLDLLRGADDSTADLVAFLDADTDLESGKIVPLARTLDYRIVIGTSDFTSQPNLVPIAIVTTSATGQVVTLQDARNTPFRLGAGSTIPNAGNTYTWPGGRSENLTGNVFAGGDKIIGSQWEWNQAVMTRLFELGGGQYWYSANTPKDLKLCRNGASVFADLDNFEIVSGNLYWRGLRVTFANALGINTDSYTGLPVYYNDIADQVSSVPGQTDLANGDCLYCDLDFRTVHDNSLSAPNGGLVLQKGQLATMGTPAVPGSRFIVAWATENGVFTRDAPFQVGTLTGLPAATTSTIGAVTINTPPFSSGNPIVASADSSGNVVAIGITRGNGAAPQFTAGTLTIGGGSLDTTVLLGGTSTTAVTLGAPLAGPSVSIKPTGNLTLDPAALVIYPGTTSGSTNKSISIGTSGTGTGGTMTLGNTYGGSNAPYNLVVNGNTTISQALTVLGNGNVSIVGAATTVDSTSVCQLGPSSITIAVGHTSATNCSIYGQVIDLVAPTTVISTDSVSSTTTVSGGRLNIGAQSGSSYNLHVIDTNTQGLATVTSALAVAVGGTVTATNISDLSGCVVLSSSSTYSLGSGSSIALAAVTFKTPYGTKPIVTWALDNPPSASGVQLGMAVSTTGVTFYYNNPTGSAITIGTLSSCGVNYIVVGK